MNRSAPTEDLTMMGRAMALAMRGRGAVESNPMVGCVIAKEGRVIGEGFHQRFGGPHAEPNALASCTQSPAGATAYVTLEPCRHRGKKTPPCVPALIAAKLARVVVGTLDPNPQVAGCGMTELAAAGLEVDNLHLPQARQLIAPFIARMTAGRPYVTLKWAESADRRIAGPAGRRVRITNELSTRIVHEMRARCDAILVGVNTVLCDDPMLTVRWAQPFRPLTRIVLDAFLRTPIDCRLVKTAGEGTVIVYVAEEAWTAAAEKRIELERRGVSVRTIPSDSGGRLSLQHALADVGALNVTHLLVEPGPTLAASWMAGDGAWDRAWVFQSPMRIGDPAAPHAPPIPPGEVAQTTIGTDRLIEFLNPKSPLTFHPDPSADFQLAAQTAQTSAPVEARG